MNEVITAETEDQIVINFITSYNIWTWRMKLIVQFKDRKIRCLYYDYKNSFVINKQVNVIAFLTDVMSNVVFI